MKAIEVNRGDKVRHNDKVYTVRSTMLNSVSIVRGFKNKTVSYSQIEKYEQTQIKQQEQ